MGHTAIRVLFWLAAVYDGVLGLAFLIAQQSLFAWFNVPPPNHPGYVAFPAAILVVFGLLFASVAAGPEANRNLIPFGMMLKVSYCAVVFWYWFTEGLPNMWKPWAVFDLLFLALFAAAYRRLPARHPNTKPI